jgi:molybdate transport system substrate-binding protein
MAGSAEAPELIVYAAASLRDVLEALRPACEGEVGVRLLFNFGASSDLARQIVAAHKADVFFSADEEWMDHVARARLVDSASRRSHPGNLLVVVGREGSSLAIAAPEDLAGPAVRRLALANPEAVPAGRYAKAWLVRAGIWERVRDRVVPGLDVRAALAAVESGAADAGVVYRTDARLARRARVLYQVPGEDAPPVSYSIAALRDRPRLDRARDLVGCLAGPAAAGTYERFGFLVPAGGR